MRFRRLLTAALAGLAALAMNAGAQEVTDPELLATFEEIEAMGPVLNPMVIQRTGELFAALHQDTEKGGVVAHRDLSYGPADKNLLDVYTPEGAEGRRPAVVFIHGGGLTSGDKDNAASDLMYANIGTYFARHDMVGINATYRLVPDITYPQGGEDMQAIVGWIRDNADTYGIDPEQIFFLCSSAGCTHVSSLLFDRDMQFEGDPDITGAIMLSGAYTGGNTDYYGADPEVMRANSPLGLAESYDGEPVPVFLFTAEFDPNGIETGTARLFLLLCDKRDACPRYMQARDHNHISINQHINTRDDRYSSRMVEFIREVTADE